MDAAWRAVRVPHDWGVEKSFDPKKPYGDAYLEPTGIGWYRRTFRLDPARAAFIKAGGLLFFESNGMMSHSKVWVNGTYVGGWPYGYTAFRCDLTPHLNLDGENTLVVRCHNHTDSSRWYTGGGMYRECRFAYCPADYLIPGSVAITTPEVTKARATVHIEWEMSKSGKKERTLYARHRGRDVPLRYPHDCVLSRRARVPAEWTPRGAEGRVPPPRPWRTRRSLQPRRDEASVPQAEGGRRKRHPLFAQSGGSRLPRPLRRTRSTREGRGVRRVAAHRCVRKAQGRLLEALRQVA